MAALAAATASIKSISSLSIDEEGGLECMLLFRVSLALASDSWSRWYLLPSRLFDRLKRVSEAKHVSIELANESSVSFLVAISKCKGIILSHVALFIYKQWWLCILRMCIVRNQSGLSSLARFSLQCHACDDDHDRHSDQTRHDDDQRSIWCCRTECSRE